MQLYVSVHQNNFDDETTCFVISLYVWLIERYFNVDVS